MSLTAPPQGSLASGLIQDFMRRLPRGLRPLRRIEPLHVLVTCFTAVALFDGGVMMSDIVQPGADGGGMRQGALSTGRENQCACVLDGCAATVLCSPGEGQHHNVAHTL